MRKLPTYAHKMLSSSRLSLLTRFSLLSLAIAAAIVIGLVLGIDRQLEQNALRQEAESAADQVATILTPNLQASDLAGPLSPDRYTQIDSLIRHNILRAHIVRVKIWSRDGLLLYSDEKNLVGRIFPESEELEQALGGNIAMEVSSLTKAENVAERGRYDRLLEVYVPLRLTDSSQVLGAYEIYHDIAVLEPRIAEMRRYVVASVGLGFVILYGSLFTLVRNASRELVRRNEENRRLYEETKEQLARRMRAEGQTRRQLERITALRTVDSAITSSMDLRVTLSILLDQVTAQLKVDAADVLLLKEPAQSLEYVAGRGFHSDAIARSRIRLGEGHAGRAALERRTMSIPDVAEVGDFARAELLRGETFAAYHVVPLIAKGQIKGVLELFHRSRLDADQEWLDFLEALASQAAIAIDNATLFDGLQRSNVELSLAYDATIEGWARALDLRDEETEDHTRRVTETTLRLARALGLGEAELVHVRRGALLHDIGKMGIPDRVLLKPAPLNDEEWDIMRRHPAYAYEMLSPIAYLRPALDIPYCHHEKWDGTGYPRGLREEQIPLAARIFAVVDVWDALRSNRPYREAWPEEKVRAYIREGAGTHFDPQVVEAFLAMHAAQAV